MTLLLLMDIIKCAHVKLFLYLLVLLLAYLPLLFSYLCQFFIAMILERCVFGGGGRGEAAQMIRAQSLILFLDICSLGDLIQSQSFRYHPYSDYSHICFSSCDFFSQRHTYMSNYLLVIPPGCLIATSSLAGLKWNSRFPPKLILTTVFLDRW